MSDELLFEEVEFFELQYLITDRFYYEVSLNDRTYGQAAGICYQSFYEHIVSNNINTIITISLIIRLMIRHDVEISKSDIDDMKRVILLSQEINYEEVLNENQIEYLEEFIGEIKRKYEKLTR
ncbi:MULTISPECIES: hypothetical protein [Brevibacillus]|uniref:hypothetical protein n=1 Tax=Brevibacillus TaxID=55080 RepID=UPI000D0EFA0B|nr:MULTISPECIES: hypothetical protein [Brevibacillus]MED1948093.1 hypothetical protein [Brevibacillus formosus]MED1998176.1 hypothetical protein [Brevibacillus formosus]MED2080717.1 hypothetical protein [Brevibacillus formosus]PSK20609.1 hypothetical protein C7R94_04245 [Brevibacillus sp. NRRL NRS-603]